MMVITGDRNKTTGHDAFPKPVARVSHDLQGACDARARSAFPQDLQGARDAHARSVIPQDLQGPTVAHAGSVIPQNLQGAHDVHCARSVARIPYDLQDHPDSRVGSVIPQDARDAHARSVAQDLQGTHNTHASIQYGVYSYDGDEDEYWGGDTADNHFAGDETIIAGKGKSREVVSDMGPEPQSILSGMDMEPAHHRVSDYDPTLDYQHNHLHKHQDTSGRDTQGQSIPLNPDSIVAFYNSSGTVKRDRDYDSESIESRQSKVHRHSTSHSAAPSAGQFVPSTKFPSRSGSCVPHDSKSPFDDSDRYGASRTTGGVFQGKAIGNVMNWGDVGMYCFILNYFQVFNFIFSDAMDVDTEVQQNPVGKVLLYTSRSDTKPAMTFKHKTTNQLPPILKGLAEKFSPIRSKYIYFLLV
jgi:hypothetical protein